MRVYMTVGIVFCDISVLTFSITYNGSMESPVPLYPTDCPPPYEAVMGQRAASQVSIGEFVHLCVSAYADPRLFWLLRQQCLTNMALSCLVREDSLPPSVEKVRNYHVLGQIHIKIRFIGHVLYVYIYKE